jgi:hypothetical protein
MRFAKIISFGVLAVGLASCATYKTTLTNDKGQSETCEASGWMGPLAGSVKYLSYKDCIDKAKARGFKENQAGASSGN